ncbi:hypothetical protein WCX72_09795 [Sulfurimonas sp. HSL1-6]|uniref:hypothetical protein n=1 Tax=Thiomicrolovo immobilis TaxID=3131935 RepID=UPI0031F841F2
MKPYTPTPEIAKGLHEGRITMLCEPLIPQPPEGHETPKIIDGVLSFYDHVNFNIFRTIPPFKAGDLIFVQEEYALTNLFNAVAVASDINDEWSSHQVDKHLIWYKADGEQLLPEGLTSGEFLSARGDWRLADSMPKWASRIHLQVADEQPIIKRLWDLTEDEAVACGVFKTKQWALSRQDFIEWFTVDEKRMWEHAWESFMDGIWQPRFAGTEYDYANNPWVALTKVRKDKV